jgi:glucose-6-phosphate 1-dehydrogenase
MASGSASKRPDPFTLVIFGASGDLTRRKLVPAVYSLFREGLLPESFAIVGFARREKSDDVFRTEMREAVTSFARRGLCDDACWERFASRLLYHQGGYDDAAAFKSLRERLGAERNCLFYFATPPDVMPTLVSRLQEAGFAEAGGVEQPWSRIIVEKPFGHDLASARALNAHVQAAFDESQVYRIDHYLGKETTQNLLVFRFANALFEPLWNQKYVDHVQIAVAETVTVEERGGYYDQAGALRDMVQNHMMHLLCLVGMEAPNHMGAHSVRDEKVKVLQALRPMPEACPPEGVVRGQYAGYRSEPGVDPQSTTETFVALKAHIDNWRWSGVPFYLRHGKGMPARITEVSIHFKPVPQVLFNAPPYGPMTPNILAIRIQPNEGISLQFQVKRPGAGIRVEPFRMDFGYADAFGGEPPAAYERLLLDAALGDPTLFTRSDEVEASWAFLQPIIEGCVASPQRQLPQYAVGSWGPKEADDLIEDDGRQWMLTRRPRARRRAKEDKT